MRALLGHTGEADDRALALTVVSKVAAHERVRLAHGSTRPRERASLPVEDADCTFLGRLKVEATADEEGLASMDDVPTLLLVVRAGSLVQRRAAADRIAERLGRAELGADDVRRIQTALEGHRDVELSYELNLCRAQLPAGRTREALKQARTHGELVQRVEADVRLYWEGEIGEEPLMKLSGDERVQLLGAARSLSDGVMAHVGALIEGATGSADRDVQRAMIAAVRYAGDARTLPSLLAVLATGTEDVVVEVARAVSRIDDPRVQPALAAAYERSVVDVERIALGTALGRVGDVRARDYVRAQLRSHDEHVITRALEALRTLGTVDDVPQVFAFMRGEDTALAAKAAHTLGRIGDGRCFGELVQAARVAMVGSVRAAAEEALDQVRARMQLRGEEAPSEGLLVSTRPQPSADARRPAFTVRLRALRLFLTGRLWALIGAQGRALSRLEQAAQCWREWAVPALAAASIHMTRGEYAQALPLFRRALEFERASIERSPMMIRQIAGCFLRRSEQVERDGRHAIARGLLDEVLSLDLRRVPSALRFEIGRRHEALRTSRTG